MANKNDGGPAFPIKTTPEESLHLNPFTIEGEQVAESSHTHAWPGMSLRDYFAAAAMQGLIIQDADEECRKATVKIIEEDECAASDIYAKLAYQMADAMLEQREK